MQVMPGSTETIRESDLGARPAKRKGRWFDRLLFLVGFVFLAAFAYQTVRYYSAKRSRPTGEIMSGLEDADRIGLSSGDAQGLNLLIITMDTTRADHLACYGHRGIQTPNIDGLARDGVLFANAFTPSPSTLPGHATIMTGLYPYRHGARANGSYKLPSEQITLAEILKEHGYATAAVISAYVLDGRFGLDQGFDLYDDDLTEGVQYGAHAFRERPAEFTNRAIFDWLDVHAGSRFFAWIHYFDPHAPYVAPEPYRTRYAAQPYDGEIAYTDQAIGHVLAKLDQLGVGDNTLLVLASDHGEGLGEHGEATHSLLVYDSTLHTPLIFHCPALWAEGQVVRTQVSNTSIVPTVLDLLGVEIDLKLDGPSLLHPAQQWPQGIYAETISTLTLHGWAPLFAIRHQDEKFIQAPRRELYDLVNDPKELNNLFDERPQDAVDLANELSQHVGEDPFGAKALAQATAMDPETAAKMRDLGYIGGVTDLESIDLQAAAAMDPKEMILHFEKIQQGTNLISAGKFHEGVELLQSAVEDVPGDVYAICCLAGGYHIMGKVDEALELYLRAIQLDDRAPSAYVAIARLYLSQRRYDEAREMLETAKSKDPDFAGIYTAYGTLALARNDREQAVKFYRQAIEMDPGTTGPSAYVEMGMMYQRALESEQAREAFEKAIEIDSLNGLARAGLGSILAQEDKLDEAAQQFAIAIRYEPNQPVILANLAGLYDKKREYDQGKEFAERALAINQNCTAALNNLGLITKHTGELDEAMELFNRALEIEPTYLACRVNLAQCHLARKEEEKAAEQFQEILKYNPAVPSALANLGVYHVNHGRAPLAMRLFARALQADPNYALAHAHYGMLVLQQGGVQQGLFHLKRSLELDPDQPGHEELEYQVDRIEQSIRATSQPAPAAAPSGNEP
jgi:arylsulfatase A-like enzyme/Tfp pilus assembly protein PilF